MPRSEIQKRMARAVALLVDKTVESIENKLTQKQTDLKGTVGDLVKLRELQEELEAEEESIREIRVTWVEPPRPQCDGGK